MKFDDLKNENRQHRLFLKRIDTAVRDTSYIGHWGDGNAGYLIEQFKIACARHGLYREPEPKIPSKALITNALRKQVFERDKYRCCLCNTWIDLTVDHIHPESKGGGLDIINLQTLCNPCNLRKGVKV